MPVRSLVDLRKLQRNQLKSINKDELIDAILSASDEDAGPSARLEARLADISKDLADLKRGIMSSEGDINKKLKEMQERIDTQASIILQQQKFLEGIDRKERENNLVMLGVPDEGEALDGATDDDTKIGKVMSVLGVNTRICSCRRLGQNNGNDGRKRPVLVIVESKGERDKILSETRKLKDHGSPYDRIYVKKDLHPAVRQEWKRLRTAEATEKNRPENQGCVIRLDVKERKLYRDGLVIDEWKLNSF